MDLFQLLSEITLDENCRAGCAGGQCPEPWYPTSDDICDAECGRVYEPFWDECGEYVQVATRFCLPSKLAALLFHSPPPTCACTRPGVCGSWLHADSSVLFGSLRVPMWAAGRMLVQAHMVRALLSTLSPPSRSLQALDVWPVSGCF